MGLAFISSKREGFEPKCDSAKEKELQSENLFSGLPEIQTELFRCRRTDPRYPLTKGLGIVVVAEGSRVLVYAVNREIGEVLQAGSKRLKKVFGKSPDLMLPGIVATVPKMGDNFSIRVDGFTSND